MTTKVGYGTHADYLFKLIVIGDSGVGKSSLLRRFADDTFSPTFVSTIGVDFKIVSIEHQSKIIKLQIWDTAGQERFQCVCTHYYRGAHGVMVVYDANDPSSLESIRTRWLPTIRRHTKEGVRTILVGNKSDRKDYSRAKGVDVDAILEEAKLLAEEEGMVLLETSAKDGSHVNAAFRSLARKLAHDIIDTGGAAESLRKDATPRNVTDISKKAKRGFFANLCNFFSRCPLWKCRD